MSRRMRWAILLYPKAWRERYASEFAALLEQTGLGWRDFFNVIGGACQMRMRSIRFTRLAAVFGAAGLLVAAVVFLLTPPRYVSKSTLNLGDRGGASGTEASTVLFDAENEVFSRTTLERIITNRDLYADRRKRDPLEDVVAQMRRGIDVRLIGSQTQSRLTPFTLSFSYSEPEMAQRVNEDITAAMIDRISRANHPSWVHEVQMLDPPSHPERPITPNAMLLLFSGLLGGLTLAVLTFGVLKLTTRRQIA